jgi:hypothetical protein
MLWFDVKIYAIYAPSIEVDYQPGDSFKLYGGIPRSFVNTNQWCPITIETTEENTKTICVVDKSYEEYFKDFEEWEYCFELDSLGISDLLEFHHKNYMVTHELNTIATNKIRKPTAFEFTPHFHTWAQLPPDEPQDVYNPTPAHIEGKLVLLPAAHKYDTTSRIEILLQLTKQFGEKTTAQQRRPNMTEVEKKKSRDMAIARLAQFIKSNIYNTDWTLVAEMCGVGDVLKQRNRLLKAQFFGDDDYTSEILQFLKEVFDHDELVGRAVIMEIIRGKEFADHEKTKLDQILTVLGSVETDGRSMLPELQVPLVDDFIKVTWIPDDFYRRLIDEINCLYRNQMPMSLSILIRKLLENLIIDILRKKYGTQELSLYYDKSRRRFHDFSLLLTNLDSKKEDFLYITPNLDKSLLGKINQYRETGNSGAHSIDINLTMDRISKEKNDINYSVQLLLRILQQL